MKVLIFFFLILSMSNADATEKVLHDFTIESISGETINLSDYKSKVVLLVNTASKCGFTPQYSGLQKIYERYKDDGLVVLGVPTNDLVNRWRQSRVRRADIQRHGVVAAAHRRLF